MNNEKKKIGVYISQWLYDKYKEGKDSVSLSFLIETLLAKYYTDETFRDEIRMDMIPLEDIIEIEKMHLETLMDELKERNEKKI